MTGEKETILSKVKKLLSLAGNNPNQEESEAAMMKAQQLLSEHGLSMAQAEQAAGVRQEACEVTANVGTKTAPWWHKSVAIIIAKNFRCDLFIRLFGGGSSIVFVGLPTDAEVAREVFYTAVRTADREAKKFLLIEKKTPSIRTWNRSVSIAVRNDYLRGWIEGLRSSFQKNVEERALLVVPPPEVREHMNKMSLRKNAPSSTLSGGSHRAHSAGVTDGSRFNRMERLSS